MTISTNELGEILAAIGSLLKGYKTAEPAAERTVVEPAPTAIEAGTFEEAQPTIPIISEPPQSPAVPDGMTAKRIAELEAELIKAKSQSASLGLQPIKLPTNNTEVLHG